MTNILDAAPENLLVPATLTRCYFHLVNGPEEILDNEGAEVSDFEDATVQARLAIEDIWRRRSKLKPHCRADGSTLLI